MYAFSHEELDIVDLEKVRERLESIRPDVVINCSAYTKVDDCETNRELAFKINAEAVLNIAKACEELGATLIHFSTDYVFDGKNSEGYKEDDVPSPINIYGESKLAGEENIRKILKNYYIIRTSWLFGPGGKNFVDTMRSLAKERDTVDVVGDQIGCP